MAIMLIFNVLILTVLTEPLQADAAYSKVATAAAKKVAKELIQDSAVQMAMDIVFEYEMKEMMQDKYEVDEGYKPVCLDNTEECKKPVQIKEQYSSTDKKLIGNKAEEILEKKSGMTGWIKWLDWIIPIFLVGTAINWLVTTLDPDTEDLFDQVGKESLEELGFIKPINPSSTYEVTDGEGKDPFKFPPNPSTSTETNSNLLNSDYINSQEIKFVNTGSSTSTYNLSIPSFSQSMLGFMIQRDFVTYDTTLVSSSFNVYSGNSSIPDIKLLNKSTNIEVSIAATNYASGGVRPDMPVAHYFLNGKKVSSSALFSQQQFFTINNLNMNDIKTILMSPTYISNSARLISNISPYYPDSYYFNASYFYYQRDFFLIDSSGNEHRFVISNSPRQTNPANLMSINNLKVSEGHTNLNNTQLSHKITIFNDLSVVELKPYNPQIDDYLINSIESSKYYETGDVTVIPPTSVPIKTPEGIQVKPDGQGGWQNVNTGEPVVVPNEDELIVEDPVKTPGGIEIPGGEEIPEIPPKPTPEETPIKEDDFEDLSCARPKKPDFSPVGDSFTHAFPFSIPWDIKRFIDNAFSGIDDERPRFELTFLGDGVVLEIPEYFDNWVSFAKTFTIIVFDIGILFLFYRFMKGGGD